MARLSIVMHPPVTPPSAPTGDRAFAASKNLFTAWRKPGAVGSARCFLGSSSLASSNPHLTRASLLCAKAMHSSSSDAT
eukprot:253919-Pleurochrysis_carterae.AAC.1